MSLNVVTHLNFRGQARKALTFYHSIFGGELTVVTYGDLHAAGDPADTDQVMWGQVAADNGFTIMAYDVQSARTFDRGDRAFYVALRGQTQDEVTTSWDGLSQNASILTPPRTRPVGPPLRNAHRPVRHHLGARRPGRAHRLTTMQTAGSSGSLTMVFL